MIGQYQVYYINIFMLLSHHFYQPSVLVIIHRLEILVN